MGVTAICRGTFARGLGACGFSCERKADLSSGLSPTKTRKRDPSVRLKQRRGPQADDARRIVSGETSSLRAISIFFLQPCRRARLYRAWLGLWHRSRLLRIVRTSLRQLELCRQARIFRRCAAGAVLPPAAAPLDLSCGLASACGAASGAPLRFFFSFSGFLISSLMPARFFRILVRSSGVLPLPRNCSSKNCSMILSNFGPRSTPSASSSPAGEAMRSGRHFCR